MILSPWMYLVISIGYLIIGIVSLRNIYWFPMTVSIIGTIGCAFLAYAAHKHYKKD